MKFWWSILASVTSHFILRRDRENHWVMLVDSSCSNSGLQFRLDFLFVWAKVPWDVSQILVHKWIKGRSALSSEHVSGRKLFQKVGNRELLVAKNELKAHTLNGISSLDQPDPCGFCTEAVESQPWSWSGRTHRCAFLLIKPPGAFWLG